MSRKSHRRCWLALDFGIGHFGRWRVCPAVLVCEEREAVLAVDQSLVKFAELLADFARKPAIWEQLHRLGTYLEAVQPGDTSDPPKGLPFVEFLGTRPWKDLVSESDYFSSAADFNYGEEGVASAH